MTYQTIQLTESQRQQFQDDGFLIIENFLPADLTQAIIERSEPIFAGEFETGIYPDEWHWRPGLSRPDITRQMCNAWKSDLMVASLALSAEVGRISATLAGWSGARMGQDCLWMKPPGATEIAMHQDGTYIEYLSPPEMMTCWMALNDASIADGTLVYVRGSHKWDLVEFNGEFHVPSQDYRAAMLQAAEQAGVAEPELVFVEVPAGGCAFHHGRTWHGLCKTTRTEGMFHSVSVHTLPATTQFHPTNPPSYIYGRYKRFGDLTMDESFFPILWTETGYRTPFLSSYCPDGLLSRVPIYQSV